MKTKAPAKNKKNLRRGRAIKRLEAKIKLSDKELVSYKIGMPASLLSDKAAQNLDFDVKGYRAKLTDELERTKKIQSAKGGSL